MIVMLFSTGVILSVGTKIVQYRKLGYAFKLLFTASEGDGDIGPFGALMTSLSATIGTGNIAGVATAIALGGPGAVFWMWITAILGGATKFSEAVLAVKYRATDEAGEKSGGPMYYASVGMEQSYGGNWKWLGWLFAFFAVIARVAEAIVPVMAIIYVIGSMIIIVTNFDALGQAFGWIFGNALTGKAVGGGLLGSVIRFGVGRGIFSNEAGLGSAPIAHAASRTNDPVRQGIIVSFGLVFFAFSTMLTWYFYGFKALEYITSRKVAEQYKWVWVSLAFVGAIASLDFVWNISGVFNGLMAIPNLVALIALSPVVFSALREYEGRLQH